MRKVPLQGGEHTRAFRSGAARPLKEERPFGLATALTVRRSRELISRLLSGAARPLRRLRETGLDRRSARPAWFPMSTSSVPLKKEESSREGERAGDEFCVSALREGPALAAVVPEWLPQHCIHITARKARMWHVGQSCEYSGGVTLPDRQPPHSINRFLKLL